jgi:hypothetical protein
VPEDAVRCPRCANPLTDNRDSTSEDQTPYAVAREAGQRGWGAMCRWVWKAGSQRLAHLGHLRESRASRRFARINIFMVSLAATIAAFTNVGWHTAYRGPGQGGTRTSPEGRGWVKLAERPTRPPPDISYLVATQLWWNPLQAGIAGGGALLLTALAASVVTRALARGSQRSLRGAYRGDPRLRCAVHYSTAWLPIQALAAIPAALRPVTDSADVAEWSFSPPRAAFHAAAAIILVVGLLFGWFWLIRLGEATPKETRGSVRNYFLIRAPLWVLVWAAVVVAPLVWGMPHLAQRLGLAW